MQLEQLAANVHAADKSYIGTITVDILTVGALLRRRFTNGLAQFNEAGVSVTITAVDKGWIETTYYGIKVEGSQPLLATFVDWLGGLAS
jgi:hypothetical protein